ncbi:MAG TPA: 50S ribosomal protein L23 [Patescibacteria group bacterium]
MILIRPIVSEKAQSLLDTNIYTFQVALKSDKYQIKKAVEDQFKVDVLKVSTIIFKPERNARGRYSRQITYTSSWKKAYVQVKDGQKIDLFEKGKK